jgi:hypothetical protein
VPVRVENARDRKKMKPNEANNDQEEVKLDREEVKLDHQ